MNLETTKLLCMGEIIAVKDAPVQKTVQNTCVK